MKGNKYIEGARYRFETVLHIKNIRTIIVEDNNIREEIQTSIIVSNKHFYTLTRSFQKRDIPRALCIEV